MLPCDIVRCILTIDATPPLRLYGWSVRADTTSYTASYSLPFRTPGSRARFVRLLAAYVGSVVASGAVEALAALLCLYHGDDETARRRAAQHLTTEYASLLTLTPLAEVDEMVGLLLDEATAHEEASEC